jgi:hypothetical protein
VVVSHTGYGWIEETAYGCQNSRSIAAPKMMMMMMMMMISVCRKLLQACFLCYKKLHLVSYLNVDNQWVLTGRVNLIYGWGDGLPLFG